MAVAIGKSRRWLHADGQLSKPHYSQHRFSRSRDIRTFCADTEKGVIRKDATKMDIARSQQCARINTNISSENQHKQWPYFN